MAEVDNFPNENNTAAADGAPETTFPTAARATMQSSDSSWSDDMKAFIGDDTLYSIEVSASDYLPIEEKTANQDVDVDVKKKRFGCFEMKQMGGKTKVSLKNLIPKWKKGKKEDVEFVEV